MSGWQAELDEIAAGDVLPDGLLRHPEEVGRLLDGQKVMGAGCHGWQ